MLYLYLECSINGCMIPPTLEVFDDAKDFEWVVEYVYQLRKEYMSRAGTVFFTLFTWAGNNCTRTLNTALRTRERKERRKKL